MPIDDSVQPCQVGRTFVVVLVVPVGGNAELGTAMHFKGPDLDFKRFTAGTNHGGVKRLVEVELGHRHVVLEAPLNWLPSCVNRTERRVTVLYGANDDSDRYEVEDFVEVATLHDHFLVDAP